MPRKRVVITGISAISPLGKTVESTWSALIAGKSGIGPITLFDAEKFDARIAGEIKNFDPEDFMSAKQAKRMDRFAQISVAAAKELLDSCGYEINDETTWRTGVFLGIGLGGLSTIEFYHAKLLEAGPARVSPFLVPMLISNMGPGQISIFNKIKGPNIVSTSACASGCHAIGSAVGEIQLGRCDAMVSGGIEATITPLAVAGFASLKALSATHNDLPEKASRPFDKNRDGFVIGEGGGMLFLESLEGAQRRGAKIYAEIVGYGATADAYHMTAPHESGEGMAMAMKNALDDAGVAPEEVEHINAHGTSTPMNDLCETRAIKTVFKNHAKNLKISATKSMTGHLLGGAGGLESVFSVLALHEGVLPGTINLENPDPECDLDYLSGGSVSLKCQYALCNSFGFGGTNASILFKRWDG